MGGGSGMVPCKLSVLAAVFSTIGRDPAAPGRGNSCSNDYVTIETIRGTIVDIKPAPEPFPTADIYLSGPVPCARIWMQVLKADAAQCHVGGNIEVRGLITSDEENNAWEIGPANNEYMTLGEDFTCS